jgi:transcriptional regulator CtsR
VLSTRFTLDKGFIVESKRGGGGYINIIRVYGDNKNYIRALLDQEDLNDISVLRAKQILQKLCFEGIITDRESEIIFSSISDKSLIVPENIKNRVRANILRNVLTCILKDVK